eukprot:gnl/TRDRNA2_/TRDRNA2_191101_c0_seq1.p1 gnl/TRDRNA2_/TRDRNA2_191101_c0~~gnl/TRDRNA2_/TRDRNA2_191101_c0_seq1.p1  ORF type:complete len:335 (+),score=82.13 gnl/TRDRNA2_/TRDRNA2_191101_c0_seq1:69-1007(+)
MLLWILGSLLLTLSDAGTTEFGLHFLRVNKERDGVKVLESGLQYKVLSKGSGKFNPKEDAEVEVNYAQTTPSLTDGAELKHESEWKAFDSSYERGKPEKIIPKEMMSGWREALLLMVEGDKWDLFIPSELAYGEDGGKHWGKEDLVKPGDVIIMRLELLKIKGEKTPRKRIAFCDVKSREGCSEEEESFLNEWTKKPLSRIEEQLKVLKKKLDTVLKTAEREKAKMQQQLLKQIAKAKKKGEVGVGWCDVATLEGCAEKESEYLKKQRGKDKEKIVAEIKRLVGMQGEKMDAFKLSWLKARTSLLNALKDEL